LIVGFTISYPNTDERTLVAGMFGMFVTVMAMATLVLPSFGADVGYNATIASGQNTFVVASNGSFGIILLWGRAR
jgi:hypothetical protein